MSSINRLSIRIVIENKFMPLHRIDFHGNFRAVIVDLRGMEYIGYGDSIDAAIMNLQVNLDNLPAKLEDFDFTYILRR